MVKLVPFRRPDADDLMEYLLGHVSSLQWTAMELQKAGHSYQEIVIPMRFAGAIRSGATLLGRRLVTADVEEPGVIVRPVE